MVFCNGNRGSLFVNFDPRNWKSSIPRARSGCLPDVYLYAYKLRVKLPMSFHGQLP